MLRDFLHTPNKILSFLNYFTPISSIIQCVAVTKAKKDYQGLPKKNGDPIARQIARQIAANRGKSRQIAANRGKSRQIAANRGKSRQIAAKFDKLRF